MWIKSSLWKTLNNIRHLFFDPPIDKKDIVRGIAQSSSAGNVNIRQGNILFPDDRQRLLEERGKLPPVSEQIKKHYRSLVER